MKINLIELRRSSGSFSSLSYKMKPPADWNTDDLSFLDEVEINIKLDLDANSLILQGNVKTRVFLYCDRCLQGYETDIVATIDENISTLQEDEKYQEDIDAGNVLQGDTLDLLPVIYENIYLAANPIKKLCDKNCKGICLRCGINLNEGSCECSDKEPDPRLAALQVLLDNESS